MPSITFAPREKSLMDFNIDPRMFLNSVDRQKIRPLMNVKLTSRDEQSFYQNLINQIISKPMLSNVGEKIEKPQAEEPEPQDRIIDGPESDAHREWRYRQEDKQKRDKEEVRRRGESLEDLISNPGPDVILPDKVTPGPDLINNQPEETLQDVPGQGWKLVPNPAKDVPEPTQPITISSGHGPDLKPVAGKALHSLAPEYEQKLKEKVLADPEGTKVEQEILKLQEMVRPLIDYNPNKKFLEDNADYGVSVDPDTLCQRSEGCDRAINFMKEKAGEGYQREMAWKLYETAKSLRLKVPCPQCYVFSARTMKPSYQQQKKFIPGIGGYKGEFSRMSDQVFDKATKNSLRFYSSTDYKPEHIPGILAAIKDISERGGAKGGMYTKEVSAAKVFAPSGIQFNISVGRDGNVGATDIEGAKALRRKYPNVGLIYVAFDDAEVKKALNDPEIDHVIPWHSSGRSKKDMEKDLGTPVKDYTKYQRDKIPGVSVKDTPQVKDYEHKGKRSLYELFLKKYGTERRFPQFENEKNYMKLIGTEYGQINKKAFNMAPKIDTKEAEKSIQERKEVKQQSMKPYMDIAQAILKQKRKK